MRNEAVSLFKHYQEENKVKMRNIEQKIVDKKADQNIRLRMGRTTGDEWVVPQS